MADWTGLVDAMKTAALDVVAAGGPVSVLFGTVISAAPLQINVEQKMTLEAPQLILSRSVTDYFIDLTAAHETEPETAHVHTIQDTYTGGGSSSPTQHLHEYVGRKRFQVHNSLAVDEEVILLRLQGGQKFLVLDRLGGSPDVTSGQWIS